jgi:hypothetical protein
LELLDVAHTVSLCAPVPSSSWEHVFALVSSNAQRRVRPTPVSMWPAHSTGEDVDLSLSVEALVASRLRE